MMLIILMLTDASSIAKHYILMHPFRTLSEKEGKQISYIKAYIWNLENRLIYLKVRNRDTEVDVEMTCRQGRGWDELGDWD